MDVKLLTLSEKPRRGFVALLQQSNTHARPVRKHLGLKALGLLNKTMSHDLGKECGNIYLAASVLSCSTRSPHCVLWAQPLGCVG